MILCGFYALVTCHRSWINQAYRNLLLVGDGHHAHHMRSLAEESLSPQKCYRLRTHIYIVCVLIKHFSSTIDSFVFSITNKTDQNNHIANNTNTNNDIAFARRIEKREKKYNGDAKNGLGIRHTRHLLII